MAGIRAAAAMLQPRSAKADLIDPILTGPEAKIRSLAEGLELDISPYRLGDGNREPEDPRDHRGRCLLQDD